MDVAESIRSRFENKKEVIIRINRYDPDRDKSAHIESYNIMANESTTVLEALLEIHEKRSPTLQIRYSCRMAMCGSCGMIINDLPRLACNTHLMALKSDVVRVGALPNFPLVRDLVTEFKSFFAKHNSVKPHLMRRDNIEQENPTAEYNQTEKELDSFSQFTHCITCGLCLAACPTASSDIDFVGPQAIGQAFRYNADSRDEGKVDRLGVLDSDQGVWRCHFAGSCTYVCPKGVDPALAIQFVRYQAIRNSLRRKKDA